MNAALGSFVPFITLIIIFAVIGNAIKSNQRKARAHQEYLNREAAKTSPGRPAPLRTNVPKGNSGSSVQFDRSGQPVPSARAGQYDKVSTSTYVPSSRRKDSAASVSRTASQSGRMIRTTNDGFLMEDRQNDWLAKQMREESRALKATSDMFDLKAQHAADCDARDLKETHARDHRLGRLDR